MARNDVVNSDGSLNLDRLGKYQEDINDVAAQLAQTAHDLKQRSINVKNFGAKGDGVTDDTSAIITAYETSTHGDTLFFPQGTYLISSTLTINRAIYIKGNGFYNTIIKKVGSGDGVVLNTSYAKMFDITVTSDGTSTNGVVIAKPNIDIARVKSSGHGQHGIKCNIDTWIININECDVFNNNGNGIHMEANGSSDQVNNVNVVGCTIHSNKGHGAFVTATGVNFKFNNFERNEKAGIYVSTEKYSVYSLNITENYFEINKEGMVKFNLFPSKGTSVFNVNIRDNFMLMLASQAVAGIKALIIAETDTVDNGISSLSIKNNFYSTDSLYYVDLGKACYKWGEHEIQVDAMFGFDSYESKYRNLGFASIKPFIKSLAIQGLFYAKGVTYTLDNKSDNVISTLPTANFPISLPSGSFMVKSGIYIETDSTNYSVTFKLLKRNAKTGGSFTTIATETRSANASSKYVESSLFSTLVDSEVLRLKPYENIYLQITFVNSGGGTTFRLHDPIVYYI